MQNQPDTVIDSSYEPVPGGRPVDAATRPTTPRRDFFDDPRRKSPVLALVLSLMPGLGQVYVGYYQQGFTHALIVASIIGILNSNILNGGAEPLFGIFLAFFWMYNVVDGWRRAVFYNNALAGIGPADLPDDSFSMTMGRGSLAGGIAMVVIGGVLLSHTLFNVPLDWLEKWWPVALIAVGAWLIYPTFLPKKNA
jgi:TM2 domain-containing membrane protein YozV